MTLVEALQLLASSGIAAGALGWAWESRKSSAEAKRQADSTAQIALYAKKTAEETRLLAIETSKNTAVMEALFRELTRRVEVLEIQFREKDD